MARGRLALVLALVSVSAPLAAATPWLEPGGGPLRSYAVDGPVPAHEEVALRVELPDPLRSDVQPVVLDGQVYALASTGVLRVGLADGTVTRLIDASDGQHLVSDGDRLYMTTPTAVSAWSLDGRPLWEVALPDVATPAPTVSDCAPPTVGGGTLFVACLQRSDAAPVAPLDFGVTHGLFVAFDAITGALRWQTPSGAGGATADPYHLAFVDGKVVALWYDRADPTNPNLARHVTAHDASTGEIRWEDLRGTPVPSPRTGAPSVEAEMPVSGKSQGPVGSDAHVHVLLDDLKKIDAGTGETEWQMAFDEQTHNVRLALADDGLVVAWRNQLFRLPEGDADRDVVSELGEGRMWNFLVNADGWIVAAAHDMTCGSTMQPQDAPRCYGSARPCAPPSRFQWIHVIGPVDQGWSRQFCSGDADLAVADGNIVVLEYPQTVTVYGRTAASIPLVVRASLAYPAPDQTVTVDVGQTASSALADDVAYRIDWGDGRIDTGIGPTFTHAYDEPGDHIALVTANNSAGQSSVEALTFHVGGSPPVAPNLVARAFANENQDLAFFVLGLVATGTAGVFGVMRMQRRRKRLARELAAIEEIYQMTHLKSSECETALAERLVRARTLLLEGDLDENQLGVVERRIEELSRKVRIETIDEQMGFLPVSMARKLRALLVDGRVERWERQHFVEALEQDAHLTPDQKTRVRALIDEWLARDAGRA